jgi:hypothetical protein
MSKEEKCPRCKVGFIQRTALTPPDKGEAIGCTRCTYPVGEPGLSYNPLEVDEGWEPPYRNKNACFEQKLAKEIGEMSDEAVEAAVKKYLPVLSDKEMRDKVKQAVAPMWHNIDALQKELEVAQSLHKVAVRERDYERTLCDNYKKDYYDLRSLYEGVLSRINKLEDDTRAAIEFADLAEDDRGTEMILEFCDDITKLVGE